MPGTPLGIEDLDFTPSAPLHPSPTDWRDQFVYFLLVDRFDDTADRPAYLAGSSPAGRDINEGRRFQGGTIKGVTRRLDYIKGLGCNTIWLSPIFKNRLDDSGSYHGYGVQDFLSIDPRFGTLGDLQELTREAHAREMYVIQDVIFNHSGDVWSYPGGHPYYYYQGQRYPFGYWRQQDDQTGLQADDAIWPIELQDPECFKRKGEIRNWYDDQEAKDGDFLSLKELDLTQAKVLDTLIQAYKSWIVRADIDGYRIDTVKHMEDSAVAIFCNAVREYAQRVGKHNFFLFGEIVADDATIQKYIGRNSRIEGTNERFPSLDAALDFPLYFQLEEIIKGFYNPKGLRDRYEGFRHNYNDHGAVGRFFVTFVDNHDQMARPYRRFMHGNPHWQQAVLAIAYLLTSPGVPCIYYGTEQGFDGGGDNDCFVRECMFGGNWGAFNTTDVHFFNSQHEIYSGIAKIAELRQQLPTLRYGRQYFREISGNGVTFGYPQSGHTSLTYSRILDTEEIVVVLNLTNAVRSDFVTVDAHLNAPNITEMENLLNSLEPPTTVIRSEDGRACLSVNLAPFEVKIFKST